MFCFEFDQFDELELGISRIHTSLFESVEKSTQRGDKLDDLEKKSEVLQSKTEVFNKSTKTLKWKQWRRKWQSKFCENIKMMLFEVRS